MQDVPLTLSYKGKEMTGFAVPLIRSTFERPTAFDIIIDKAFLGTLRMNGRDCKMDTTQDPRLVQMIGEYILAWYDPSSGMQTTFYMGSSPRTEQPSS